MMNGTSTRSAASQPGPDCAAFAALLPVLEDLPELAPGAASAHAHLATCAYCRAQRAAYAQFDEALVRHLGPDATFSPELAALDQFLDDTDDALDAASALDAAGRALALARASRSTKAHAPRRPRRVLAGLPAVAAVLLLSLLAGLIFASRGRPSQMVNNGTHVTPTAQVVPGSSVLLSAIGMSSPDDGWAVGESSSSGNDGPAYVLHYSGGLWSPVSTSLSTQISAIKMLSPTDGWAVGFGIWHYDGHTWSKAEIPILGYLRAIEIISPSDVWVGGENDSSASPREPTILHYDGHTWTSQPTPALQDFASVESISMVSANEGWAVGYTQPSSSPDSAGSSALNTGFILHYTSGAWQLAQTIPNASLSAISMDSATDGWAGGRLDSFATTINPRVTPLRNNTPTLWHFSNGAWNAVALQLGDPGSSPDGQITGVTMFSATEGWLIISTDADQIVDNNTRLADAIFHFEGGQWKEIPRPRFENRQRVASGGHNPVAFLSPTDFWLVGGSIWWDEGPTITPLIAHYHDGAWTLVEY